MSNGKPLPAPGESAVTVPTTGGALAQIVHDLRTPLSAVVGHLQWLHRLAEQETPIPKDILLDHLEAAVTAIERVRTMLNALTEPEQEAVVGSVSAGTDLLRVIQCIAAEVRQTRPGHEIVVDSAITSLNGAWDEAQLSRVVENLLTNAVKYSFDDGAVIVRVEEITGSAPAAQLIIQDNGRGIPTSELPLIFTPYFRGSNVREAVEGSGIGLAAAKQIIEQFGGSIEVDSRDGSGTTVTVVLPLTPVAPPVPCAR